MKQMRPFPHCRISALALSLLILVSAGQSLTAQLPAAPATQPSSQTATAIIDGYVADSSGDSIPNARVTLTRDGQPPVTVITSSDGSFTFSSLAPGPFQISIAAPGFVPQQTSGALQPGAALDLPTFALAAASTTTNIDVIATPTDIAEAQVKLEEHQRVLGAIPNFYVVYDDNPVPLDPRQKSELALRSLIDPVNLALNGAVAGVQQATDTYAWQQGAHGYAKRYAAAYGTFLTSDLLTNAVFPILFHQDPRYYYKGTGSVRSRAGYAIANAVMCKGDNGHWQVNFSGILGGLGASAISNAYYPAANRAGVGLTFEGAAIGTGISAVANLFQEFVVRKLTPHIPPVIPN